MYSYIIIYNLYIKNVYNYMQFIYKNITKYKYKQYKKIYHYLLLLY